MAWRSGYQHIRGVRQTFGRPFPYISLDWIPLRPILAERVDSVRVMINSGDGGEARGLESKVEPPGTGKHAKCGQVAHKPTLGTLSDTIAHGHFGT